MKSKIFIYLGVLGLSCRMWGLVPWRGIEPGPLHWEQGVLATGPPGKSPKFLIFKLRWNSRGVKLAILKCPCLWHWGHSRCCTIIASAQFQNQTGWSSPQNETSGHWAVTPCSSLSPWQLPSCFLYLWAYLLWIFHMNGSRQYVTYCAGRLPLSVMLSWFIHTGAYASTSF